ncbi:unnamed protein product [Debaryomyces fabryi]|nr:unnamed protein product [Debaryomyces fabryi]
MQESLEGNTSVTSTVVDSTNSIIDQGYLLLDTFLYYVFNAVVLLLNLTDVVNEFTEKVSFNYQIVYTSFKHKMYNNIN